VVELTLWSSLKTTILSLWDEEQQKLVGFGYLKIIRQREASTL
jgi:hypothetical protein